jgi:hypothetical protein
LLGGEVRCKLPDRFPSIHLHNQSLANRCTTSVQISLNLEHGATTLNRTWTAFKRSSISPTYLLSYPLIVSISSETPYLGTPGSSSSPRGPFNKGKLLARWLTVATGVTLTQVDTLYNAFEYFEQDDECHVSKVMIFTLVRPMRCH